MEDRLISQLMNLKVDAVRMLCEECGVNSNGSCLRTKIQNKQDYNNVFEMVCGASGGLAAIMCPCGIVYSLKFNIGAESPRDFADMLLAWKHLPNISVCDSAQALVNHTNGRQPENLPFQPHDSIQFNSVIQSCSSNSWERSGRQGRNTEDTSSVDFGAKQKMLKVTVSRVPNPPDVMFCVTSQMEATARMRRKSSGGLKLYLS